MNTTDTTIDNVAVNAAPTTPPKSGKPHRRMARPPKDEADAVALPTAIPPAGERVPAPATGSKTAAVIALLERADGATLAELMAATGWLPHTTRAALTGLRKKGHAIERFKRGEETCYLIVAGTPANFEPA